MYARPHGARRRANSLQQFADTAAKRAWERADPFWPLGRDSCSLGDVSLQQAGGLYKNGYNFPDEARRDAGFQLDKVQRGLLPDDWKPIATMPSGVQEIRVRDDSGIYRVIYVRRRYDELIWSKR